ncbi:iron complex transport system substrate-binding protein [Campylobacter lari]|uniref:Iron ABC transporter, periplasmic iron-binding protein n=1 Tax=Campylobacter lari NCTC 11845 TaxID=1388749 RepID=A0A0A8HY44_CAMLA|nr:siderophore ABC transporter substrate-binding protein [Campylobacter lari]AJD01700.1 iron ABC transporter, periplasmic iron-binding protein [Campylobacter lari NCTC 11845]EAK9954471.1 iron ABC transporter substrate-binding protein [Campylobacter lari]STA74062.1 iron complex transport system substrate-binding protein [Campylobacter lari]VEJ06600.1 iron complex transport system substrate-binding protein [Campylobacter lari]
MKKTIFCILAMFLMFGCSKEEYTKDSNATLLEIKHDLGSTKVVKNPSRVIVFDYGILDSLKELNLSDKIIGVPLKNLPKYLDSFKNVENVGGVQEPNFETIYKLKPDLIIVSGRQAKNFKSFEEIAPTLYLPVDTKDYLNSFEKNLNILGDIFDKKDLVKEKFNALLQDINHFKSQINPTKKGLIILTNANKMSAFGSKSRFGIIHDVLDVKVADENISVSTHGKNISPEYILKINPDYIFVVDRDAIVGGEGNARKTIENPIVKKTNAYKNNHIFYINPEYWYLSGGGLISIKIMLEEIIKDINKDKK